MAREMALAGVNPEELAPPPPPQKPRGFKAKWENYWYHYKWPTLIVLFVLAVGAWILIDQLTKEKPDYILVAVTEQPLLPQETQALETYLASCGEDLDEDGQVEVNVENLNPAFEDPLAPTIASSDTQKLISYLSTGDRMLFAFDKPSYEGFARTTRDVAGEDYRFFSALQSESPGYRADERYWSWRDDARRGEGDLATCPKEMFFGVREPQGTAGGKRAREMFEQGRTLLYHVMDSAVSGGE